ncbi:Choline transport protein [Cyphellophora attinorum]|uniref:Choline transport protein n=1 Tax=Cyphellophora attinorum TaxID=1664694 RepID=A0A0N1H7A3_9EURO|nr:Choline transport protein [Phialophora attinorum]KPI42284.1 Choline transport protein [Phialophora attinorum]
MYQDQKPVFRRHDQPENVLRPAETTDEGQMLQVMGYEQQTVRNYSILSLLGMGFALTNSWWAISTSMIVGLPSGGTVGIIYGLCLLFLASLCVGATLSELGSAYPNSGGQYYWTSQLAPRSTRRLLAYVTGYLSWAGAIFTSVSVAIAVGQGIVGMVQYNHPELVIDRWMVFLTAELVNVAAALFNLYSKFLPTIATVSLYVTLSGFIVTFVTVMASSSGKYNSSDFVFTHFVNETGWSNDAVAVIVGLINPSWAFPCLDAATHLAEECARPERAIPIAIMGTVIIGFST